MEGMRRLAATNEEITRPERDNVLFHWVVLNLQTEETLEVFDLRYSIPLKVQMSYVGAKCFHVVDFGYAFVVQPNVL
jgi:hypothetical protein